MSDIEDKTVLDQLRERRQAVYDELAAKIEARSSERTAFETRDASDTKPTDEERQAFIDAETAAAVEYDARERDLVSLDRRIKEEEMLEKRRLEAAKASSAEVRVAVVSEPLTYRRDNADEFSYFKDLAIVERPTMAAAFRSVTPHEAQERILRHAKEVDAELPKRAAERERRAKAQVEKAELEFRSSFHGQMGVSKRGIDEMNPFEQRVNPSRTPGQGGYAVPPMWLMDDYIRGLRAGRVAAGLVRSMDLPEGTDSINIPKLSTLTKVDVQSADNAAVASQDISDTFVQANVKTVAGQEDVAIQLIDQSPGHLMDEVIMTDLMADYNRLVDRQVIYGNGINTATLNGGQILGVYPQSNWSGTNVVTYTQASPTGSDFLSVTGAMASQIATNRFNTDIKYLCHPRRWFWFATSLDANRRPLVEGGTYGPWNVAAMEQMNVPAEGLVGAMPFGPPVYIDANVPTTDNNSGGTGGTSDVAIAAVWDDIWLFEGNMRTRVLDQPLSGTLELRFQVYNYIAMLTRYGQSIAIAEGSGFAPPTGAVSSILF